MMTKFLFTLTIITSLGNVILGSEAFAQRAVSIQIDSSGNFSCGCANGLTVKSGTLISYTGLNYRVEKVTRSCGGELMPVDDVVYVRDNGIFGRRRKEKVQQSSLTSNNLCSSFMTIIPDLAQSSSPIAGDVLTPDAETAPTSEQTKNNKQDDEPVQLSLNNLDLEKDVERLKYGDVRLPRGLEIGQKVATVRAVKLPAGSWYTVSPAKTKGNSRTTIPNSVLGRIMGPGRVPNTITVELCYKSKGIMRALRAYRDLSSPASQMDTSSYIVVRTDVVYKKDVIAADYYSLGDCPLLHIPDIL